MATSRLSNETAHLASFRDPSGYVFWHEHILYRGITEIASDDFALLASSGLYDDLTKNDLLVRHSEVSDKKRLGNFAKVIRPEMVPFISYPYEWSFSQLKDAALLTLDVQKKALAHGMSLKDASAYNVQFVGCHPIMIDTLSFEQYHPGPWVAYRQFCQHFLAPLAAMAYADVRLQQLLLAYLDGLPLDLASKLLPRKTWAVPGLLIHLHLHAKSQLKYAGDHGSKTKTDSQASRMTKESQLAMLDNLAGTIKALTWKPSGTEWADYYDANNNYNDASLGNKVKLIADSTKEFGAKVVWDVGGNTGVFSEAALKGGAERVMTMDIDPSAVERLYLRRKHDKDQRITPMVANISNPAPGIGWVNTERTSLLQREQPDMLLALALIHHLTIGQGIPLTKVAEAFARQAKHLVIEFVPKADGQVVKLLANREDIFSDYDENGFEAAFGEHFSLKKKQPVKGSLRTLYIWQSLVSQNK